MADEYRFPAVVFDVDYEWAGLAGSTALDEDEVMLQIFAETEGVTLKANSPLEYQSSNYDLDEDTNIWFGELAAVRKGRTLNRHHDPTKGYRSQHGDEVETTQDITVYAYDPESSRLVMWERAGVPHTRMMSYVKRAAAASGYAIDIDLLPHTEERTFEEHLRAFDKVDWISLKFRHSQSPGSEFIDEMLETLEVKKANFSLQAEDDKLDIEKLISEKQFLPGQIVEHVSLNPKNGSAMVQGTIAGEHMKISTRDEVVRSAQITSGPGLDDRTKTLIRLARDLRNV